MNNFIKSSLKISRGTTTTIFAFSLAILTGISALVVDVGFLVYQKAQLTVATDSAALAGALELVNAKDTAENIAQNYIQMNITDVNKTYITIDNDNRGIAVSAEKKINNFFAKIFNQNSENIQATAKAKIENIASLSGCRPMAIVQQTFVYGNQYTLKEGGGDGTSGNYAALALGENGAAAYGNNILNGYQGIINVDDQIPTETGNIAGTTESCINGLISSCNHSPSCTYDKYNSRCQKIIFIPVVNTLEINGKKYVQVLGFATFFLEGVTRKSGQADVIGRFITYCIDGKTSSEIRDFGTYGIKLIK